MVCENAHASSTPWAKVERNENSMMKIVSILFMVNRIKKLPCNLHRKGSLLLSIYCSGPKIIFFLHLSYDRRQRSYGCHRHLNCLGCCLSWNSNCGFRHCSCCLNYGLNSMRNFSKTSCFCYNCRSTSCFCCGYCLSCCFCCRCLCHLRKSAMRMSLAGVHILSWSVRDGCC